MKIKDWQENDIFFLEEIHSNFSFPWLMIVLKNDISKKNVEILAINIKDLRKDFEDWKYQILEQTFSYWNWRYLGNSKLARILYL